MSAYIVERETIEYLVNGALYVAGGHHQGDRFTWYAGSREQGTMERWDLHSGNVDDIGQMLWEENVRSVAYRYKDDLPTELPGATGAPWLIPYRHRFNSILAYIDDNWQAQVMKSADCYEYQSCEHPSWQTSAAKGFVDTLRKLTWALLPGYEEAEWGHPSAKVQRYVAEIGFIRGVVS